MASIASQIKHGNSMIGSLIGYQKVMTQIMLALEKKFNASIIDSNNLLRLIRIWIYFKTGQIQQKGYHYRKFHSVFRSCSGIQNAGKYQRRTIIFIKKEVFSGVNRY